MKKQFISESRLREIISEETLRMKKRITLESEKKSLIKKLNEMYMEEETELEEGWLDKDPEKAKAEAEKVYQTNYKNSEVKSAEASGIDVPTYKAKVIEFLISNKNKPTRVIWDDITKKMIIPTPDQEREMIYNRTYKKREVEAAEANGIDVPTYHKGVIDYLASTGNKVGLMKWDPAQNKMVTAGSKEGLVADFSSR